ncbi:hypothetical protein WS97_09635 [Burkholderia territorii]|nr:hypothetical protein WS97_09635 [Burkholderia territorii]KWO55874.1 hypothetical protein WT98_07055 [Burkholderia territorii]
MCALLRVLYVLFYMLDGIGEAADLSWLLDAEVILERSVQVAASGRDWNVDDQGIPVIEAMLLRFDEVIGNVPAFRYQAAWEKMAKFAQTDLQSPIPGSRVGKMWLDHT